ncbi:MAG: endonuclease/exonuclease/phosphatase family protein [Flavobacteriales bacterium]|nr:endonuclease/exonuclease/phosphatase family protein [Flavobacteriales bacterium]
MIVPYTPLGRRMVRRVTPLADEQPLTLLVCNVLQTNRDHASMAHLIAERKPDVVVLLETDEGWRAGIRHAVQDYEHRVEVPLANTYGMLLYARLPLAHHEVKYLVEKDIPSIIADVLYRGTVVRLFILHPTPPVPQENETSTERDAEVLLVGRMAKAYDRPCIVLGDLNDVAWSRTTELFLKASGLLDPRRGRGMYNTFHAHYPFLRWPLDHFFVSSQFRLVNMRVERTVGSDHFPMSLSVVLRPDDPSEELPIAAAEQREVSEKIAAGRIG